MSTRATSERDAAHAHLLAADPALAALAAAHGPVDPYTWPGVPVMPGDLLAGLALHITAQQISVTAALAIFGRLQARLGGEIDAAALAALDDAALREVGMSRAKARALHELGERVATGEIDLEALREAPDDVAQARLITLRGIGPWSAQMFLLHELHRPDVFPAGDLGLRHALAALDGLPAPPSERAAVERAAAWAPYRSYAAAHLWRSLRQTPL